jgi:sterol desaturase/sphingolipid hydroxylase (fatty acid hydroxylase superfamily)
MNESLALFWLWFSKTDLAKWDMLEAFVAGSAFGFWIMMYRGFDQLKYFSQFRFSTDAPLPLFRKNAPNAWMPLFLYIALIRLYHWVYPKPAFGLESPTIERLLFEVAEGILYYDFIFFWIHLAMHKMPRLAWLFGHNVHHDQEILCANEVQHHSFVDGSLQVIVNMIVQNVSTYGLLFGGGDKLHKHFLSRLIHNVVITYMLTETHAGYDGWWCMHNLCPALLGGAKLHEVHHRVGNKYYQPFFRYLDLTLEWTVGVSMVPALSSAGQKKSQRE